MTRWGAWCKLGKPTAPTKLQLYSLKETEKQKISDCSLHEQMVYEVEDFVERNWGDIAIHDRRKLEAAEPNTAFAWIVSKFGSYLTPLFCDYSDQEEWEEDPFSPIEILFFRWLKQQPFEKSSDYLKSYAPKNSKCFIIVKGNDDYDGTINPVGYRELMDFVLVGLSKVYLDK